MSKKAWLDVDVRGFAQSLGTKGVARIALEPISNALDTNGTDIDVRLTRSRQYATLIVIDNDPQGFQDLADCWTLYAPSRRRDNAEKRGRFGQGEKELIALCADGGTLKVASTTGTVVFDGSGRSASRRIERQSGSGIQARFRMSVAEAQEFEALVSALIVPPNISLRYQGVLVPSRTPSRVIPAVALDTVGVDGGGVLRRQMRPTDVELFEPLGNELPTIYELGVPVVEHDGCFHINVLQKIPLNRDRDNVTPSYRKRLNAAVVTAAAGLMTQAEAERGWVREALPHVARDVAADLLLLRFGAKTAVYDPSDREASKTLQDEGYTIIHGRSLTLEEHAVVRQTGVFKPAGKIRPSGVESSSNGHPPIPREQWTLAMKAMANYVRDLGKELLDRPVVTEFYNIPRTSWLGCAYHGNAVALNIGTLGSAWVETPNTESVDALLLHEFAHLTGATDHLSRDFYTAVAELGAKLRGAAAKLLTPRESNGAARANAR